MKTENRKQKTENRKQKTENRKQKTENRKQKTGFSVIYNFNRFNRGKIAERLYTAGTPAPIRSFMTLPDENIVSAEPIGSVLTGPRKIDEKLLKFDQ
ncbi:MAG: hypothetical protein AB2547_01305 [Candidatus Thiodiazotropha endolucinida]